MNFVVKRNNNLSFIDELFDDFISKPAFRSGSSCMRTDIREVENGYELDIDVPGYGKEDITITLDKGYLTVEAKKESTSETQEQHFLRRERILGNAARSFYVGEEIHETDIRANYLNGILTVFIPKNGTNIKEKKQIAIQ
jgi:HSP20 family protein